MPNTIVHIGVQTLLQKKVDRTLPLHWIFLGTIIPDLPWILLRIFSALEPLIGKAAPDPVDFGLYAIVQASLFMCIIFSAAMACLAKKPLTVFAVLASGSLLHLLLDSLEIKWANGVHLFAPLDWQLFQAGQVWPEHLIVYLLSGLGVVVACWHWRTLLYPTQDLARPDFLRMSCFSLLLLVWLVLPLLWMPQSLAADNHYLATLTSSERQGRPIEINSKHYGKDAESADAAPSLRLFTGERLILKFPAEGQGEPLMLPALLSVKGFFTGEHEITVTEWHQHDGAWRDNLAFLGLFLVAFSWFMLAVRYVSKRAQGPR